MNRRLFFEMMGTAAVAMGVSKSANSESMYGAEAKIKQLGLICFSIRHHDFW